MKLVAVSQRVDLYPDRGERRDALDQRLGQWLTIAGYLPAPVPNSLISSARPPGGENLLLDWLDATRPSAVVLSGGNDIGEAPERDETERELLTYARTRSLPVLGICRGMQMMAVNAGGELAPVAAHTRVRHALVGELSGEVNSYHDHALASCPDGFTVTAAAADGCIEAIRHERLAWEGWMWHPEREAEFRAEDMQWLRRLFGK